MTREHLWPRWMKSFARSAAGRYRFGVTGAPGTLKDFVAPAFSQTLRRVYPACNSGWMAQLEAEVQRLVLRMDGGTTVVLGYDEQHLLSRWLFKTALVTALLWDHVATRVDEAHYRIAAQGAMPSNTTVWLGRYNGADMEAGSWLHRFEWTDRQAPHVTGDGYIFVVSALSLVGFGIVMGGSLPLPPILQPGSSLVDAFRRIWPASANYVAIWPTSPALSLGDIDAMLGAFRAIGGDTTPTSVVPGQ